jgi:hypothetical protein
MYRHTHTHSLTHSLTHTDTHTQTDTHTHTHTHTQVGAVTLYDQGDEIEVVSLRKSDQDMPEAQMDLYTGPIWDTTKSAEGVEFEGNTARRVEGQGLPVSPDTLVFLHRFFFFLRLTLAARRD